MAPPVLMAVPVVPAPPVLEIDCGTPAALTPAVLPVSTAPAAVVADPAAVVAPAAVAAPPAAAAPVAPAAGVASAAALGDSPPPRVDRLCSGTVSTWMTAGVVARAAVPAVVASVAGVLPATDPKPPSVPAAEPLGIGGSPHLMLSDWMFCGSKQQSYRVSVTCLWQAAFMQLGGCAGHGGCAEWIGRRHSH
jgi:hypothetical protein